jgi:hypothetical protein
MGERVLFQVVKGKQFSPVVYCHWSGDEVRDICDRLMFRMTGRAGDLDYVAARLVQECINNDPGNLSYGLWNADHILTEDDSHGDGGVVLVDVSEGQMKFRCFGGYWRDGDPLPERMTWEQLREKHFYESLNKASA